MKASNIAREIESLPPDAKKQVVDFLAFLKNRYPSKSPRCQNKTEVQHIERFLKRFQKIKLTEAISDIAADLFLHYRPSHGITIPDALIAATAIACDQSFISKNQRDYKFIKGLKLLNYPF
jgi:predicted nucleic acid-binding protein